MKTKLSAISIPNYAKTTPEVTFIKDGEFKTIPISLPKIEDYLNERNYKYDICLHSDYQVYYNFQKSLKEQERDELIDKILFDDDSTKWVVIGVFAPGMKLI